MDKYELKYMNIKYSEKDISYINELVLSLDNISEEIVEFFNIDIFGEKVEVRLWDNLDSFRDYYKEINNKDKVNDWLCGFAHTIDNIEYIEILSLSEYIKTKSHENSNLDDLKYLILHEFTHSCHNKVNKKRYAWLSEGLATTISHQYDNKNLSFNTSLNNMMYGGANYNYYHTMFYYTFTEYGKEYVDRLIRDFDFLKKETPRLYQETVNYMKNNKKGIRK